MNEPWKECWSLPVAFGSLLGTLLHHSPQNSQGAEVTRLELKRAWNFASPVRVIVLPQILTGQVTRQELGISMSLSMYSAYSQYNSNLGSSTGKNKLSTHREVVLAQPATCEKRLAPMLRCCENCVWHCTKFWQVAFAHVVICSHSLRFSSMRRNIEFELRTGTLLMSTACSVKAGSRFSYGRVLLACHFCTTDIVIFLESRFWLCVANR